MRTTPAPAATPATAPAFSIPKSVGIFAVLYLLAWSLLPPLLAQSFPLDVVESLTWGREWQWGTYKHPPLAPAVLHMFWLAFGKAGPFLLSQLCIAATLWCVWGMGQRLVSRERAFVGTVLAMGVFFYTYPALEFNHNIAQMPLWAGLGWCFLLALQEGKLRHWLLLGLLAGLAMLTKYSMGVVLACLGAYLLLSPARRLLARPGPWLALGVMLAVLSPHLVWLWQSDWLPMAYASRRAATDSAYHPALSALNFVATQALNHLPMAVIVLVAAWRARKSLGSHRPVSAPEPDRLHTAWPGFLLTMALGPAVLIALLGLLAGLRLHDMWGAPIWAFSGLLVAAALPAAWVAPLRPRILCGLAVWLVLISVLAGTYLAYGAQWRNRPARTDWPAAALGAQAQSTWSALSTCPLDVVAGNYWLAGLATVASPDRPSILIEGDPRYSPWVTLARLQEHGALWMWEAGAAGQRSAAPPPLDQLHAGEGMGLHEGVWQVPWHYSAQKAPLTVHWRAYVPSACAR